MYKNEAMGFWTLEPFGLLVLRSINIKLADFKTVTPPTWVRMIILDSRGGLSQHDSCVQFYPTH